MIPQNPPPSHRPIPTSPPAIHSKVQRLDTKLFPSNPFPLYFSLLPSRRVFFFTTKKFIEERKIRQKKTIKKKMRINAINGGEVVVEKHSNGALRFLVRGRWIACDSRYENKNRKKEIKNDKESRIIRLITYWIDPGTTVVQLTVRWYFS